MMNKQFTSHVILLTELDQLGSYVILEAKPKESNATRNFTESLVVLRLGMTSLSSNYYIYDMAYVLLILISLAGLALCAFYLKKNIVRIKDKNKSEQSKYKRVWNYVPTGLWYGYLIIFFAGLTINNTIF